jgi:hypothetical protein
MAKPFGKWRRDPFNPKKLYAATLTEIMSVKITARAGSGCLPAVSPAETFGRWQCIRHGPTKSMSARCRQRSTSAKTAGARFASCRHCAIYPTTDKWTFPPGAHVAHARSIALDARVPDEIVVGIEEGGVARSRDRGATWEDISGPSSPTAFPKVNDPAGIVPYEMGRHEEGRVYRDVHWVMRHPSRLETLYAARVLAPIEPTTAGNIGLSASTVWDGPTRFQWRFIRRYRIEFF